MSRVVLSAAARVDRREITAWTFQRFGMDQARRLRDRFEATLSILADSPHIGRTQAELDPPGHSLRYFVVMKVFLIVYEVDSDGIRVVRLLHGARHLAEELDRDPGDED